MSSFSRRDQSSTPSDSAAQGARDARHTVLYMYMVINYWNTDYITPTSWTNRGSHTPSSLQVDVVVRGGSGHTPGAGSHSRTFCMNVFKWITATEDVSCYLRVQI